MENGGNGPSHLRIKQKQRARAARAPRQSAAGRQTTKSELNPSSDARRGILRCVVKVPPDGDA